jgi:hypothetical protein
MAGLTVKDRVEKESTVIKICIIVLSLGGLFSPVLLSANDGSAGTPALGARLFLETRFSRFYFVNSGGNANATLAAGDPVMDTTASPYGPLPGPFAGQSMNCRACHLVAEQEAYANRTYADFAQRSPVPANGDGRTQTPRNSISLVDSLAPRATPLFLHFDGQFATPEDLVIGTFAGRNFGWKPSESATAISHIAHVIRSDDGNGPLALKYGGLSYAKAFAGSEQIENRLRILPAYRLYNVAITNAADPRFVSDTRIAAAIGSVVRAYLENLVFSRDTNGLHNGSPYDVFLAKNALPRAPDPNETPIEYSVRLLQLIKNIPSPVFVTDPSDGHFATRSQTFQFGSNELAGLKIFFAQPSASGTQSQVGNCFKCHPAPAFTDFLFHNNGAAQEEYEAIHGPGSFLTLNIPELSVRQSNYDAYLPPTPTHPNASGSFITPPTLSQLAQSDLGLWNVFANPDFPAPQNGLQQILPEIISQPAPFITSFLKNGSSLIFSSTNGTPGWPCHLLGSTDPSVPLAAWKMIATNLFDPTGQTVFTNPIPANGTGFYRISLGIPSPALALPQTIALFKTPNLRDLGSSDPYFHTGRMNTLENVISFYQKFSGFARSGAVRNAAPELRGIFLDNTSAAPLAAFLRSLNEDYLDPVAASFGQTSSRSAQPPNFVQ